MNSAMVNQEILLDNPSLAINPELRINWAMKSMEHQSPQLPLPGRPENGNEGEEQVGAQRGGGEA